MTMRKYNFVYLRFQLRLTDLLPLSSCTLSRLSFFFDWPNPILCVSYTSNNYFSFKILLFQVINGVSRSIYGVVYTRLDAGFLKCTHSFWGLRLPRYALAHTRRYHASSFARIQTVSQFPGWNFVFGTSNCDCRSAFR